MNPPPPAPGTETAVPLPPQALAEPPSALQSLRSRGRVRGTIALLGPAFVAAIAYVDPGNFATNIAGGSKFGYLLLWVILAANLMAMLIQNLSGKIGIATGKNLAELCREHFPRGATWGLWAQAELIAMATDLAEFIGAAIALNLLFGVPLFTAGLMTGVVAFALLGLQQRGHRTFEIAIAGLLAVILLGFLYNTLEVGAEDQTRLFTAMFARQLVRLGALPKEAITTELLLGLNPADWNAINAAVEGLQKKLLRDGPLCGGGQPVAQCSPVPDSARTPPAP